MQTTAKLSNLRMAPKKVRVVVDAVRGVPVVQAREILNRSKKHAARPVLKLLESAVANAKHNHQAKEESLVVAAACVDQGRTLHRWMPRAMGRATPLRLRSSHITITLRGEAALKQPTTKKAKTTTTTKTANASDETKVVKTRKESTEAGVGTTRQTDQDATTKAKVKKVSTDKKITT